jgi:YfiH family protein
LESRSEHASRDEALLREGDAHFCTSRNVGLLVKTADCLPVLMFAEDQILSVAVHAGWRGIANEILRETVRALSHRGVKPEKLYVVIGPHIRQKSFEVDEDVARQLERTAERASPRDSGRLREIVKLGTSADGSLRKYFVDLEQVAVEQLAAEGILRNRIHTCRCWNLGASLSAGAFDTKTQPDWASYRRDGKSAGRNLSFIAQL